jgi:hypothetical protein
MGDEVLARAAPLVGVTLAREEERVLDHLQVDPACGVIRVLLDHREEVAEQLALLVAERGGRAGGTVAVGLVYGPMVEIRPLFGDRRGLRAILARGRSHAK